MYSFILVLNFVLLINQGITLNSTIPGARECETITDCEKQNLLDSHILCASKKCRCEPNFHWDPLTKECKPFVCKSDQDCQEYDKYRDCIQNTDSTPVKRCDCNPIFVEIKGSKICFPRISGDCATHFNCQETGDKNTVCIGQKCRCKVNFIYDVKQKKCIANPCTMALDCQEIDPNRECQNSKCVCKAHMKESTNDDLCYDEDLFTTPAHY